MWRINSIQLKNIATFVDVLYEIKQGKATLIQGQNFDDEGQESNGSGKSILIESIYTGITGLQFRGKDLTTSDMVRTGEKKGEIIINMYNSLSEKSLIINRVISVKSGNELELIYGDENQKDKYPTVPDRQKRIIELIDISVEDLRSYYIINKESYQAFFLASDTKKKETISRFSKANLLDGIEDKVEIKAKDKRKEVELIEKEILSIESKIEVYQEQLDNQIDPIKSKQEKIDKVNVDIKLEETSIENNKQSIIKIENEIDELTKNKNSIESSVKSKQKELDSYEIINYDEKIKELESSKTKIEENKTTLNINISKIEKSSDEVNSTIKELKVFKQELETIIEGAIECPKCKHQFVYGKDVSVSEAKIMLPDIISSIEINNSIILEKEAEILKIKRQISDINNKVNEVDIKIRSIKELLKSQTAELDLLESNIRSFKNKIDNIDSNISSKQSQKDNIKKLILNNKENIISLNKRIDAIKSEEIVDNTKDIKDTINTYKNIKLVELNDSLISKKQELLDIECWNGNFKRFKSYLANKSIKSIEGFTNFFLKKSKSNLQVEIEGFKMKKDGTVSEKITANILRNGEFEATFSRFSKGEKGRVEIMCIIAMQSLINMNCKSGGLDLLFTDEITESIDRIGIEYMVDGLNKLNKTINIITHSSHEKSCENIITIIKQNRISKIK